MRKHGNNHPPRLQICLRCKRLFRNATTMPRTTPSNQAPSTWVRASYQSPLGSITLCSTGTALCGLWFDGQQHQPDLLHCPESSTDAILGMAKEQLDAYFSNAQLRFTVPLAFHGGTAFQHSVWHGLCHIPAGQTCTYSQLSQQLGRPGAVRAVAGAIGRNPLSIVVPCHRVIGANGSLTGYAGGLARKRDLLQREHAL